MTDQQQQGALTYRDAARATLAARERMQCDLIGSRACFGGGLDPVLVVYRPTGTSIVMVMQERLSVEAYCEFVRALTRDAVAERVRNEALLLRIKRKGVKSAKAAEQLERDATALDDLAAKFAAPVRITSDILMTNKRSK